MRRLADFIAGIDGAGRRRAWQRHLDTVSLEATRHWDDLLQALPEDAWATLRAGTLQQIDQRNATRGWPQAEHRFNEARGFLYLLALGCDDVRFAPPSMATAGPDLLARRSATTIACEVKTVHIDAMSAHLARKLGTRLQDAVAQLRASGTDEAFIYLVAAGSDVATIRDRIDAARLSPCRLVIDCDGIIETLN